MCDRLKTFLTLNGLSKRWQIAVYVPFWICCGIAAVPQYPDVSARQNAWEIAGNFVKCSGYMLLQ